MHKQRESSHQDKKSKEVFGSCFGRNLEHLSLGQGRDFYVLHAGDSKISFQLILNSLGREVTLSMSQSLLLFSVLFPPFSRSDSLVLQPTVLAFIHG